MTITDIKIRLLNDESSKLKAVATITIDECFVVHDIKIILGNNGPFIAMPSRRISDGEYKDIAHPINIETRSMLVTSIINAYNKALQENN